MARQMKDSGIEWIGEIPETWDIVRIGSQYTERRTKVSDTEYPPLSVTMKGIMPQLATAAKTDAHDDRKLVCVGDFAINSRSDRRGSCGISAYDGSVSLINTILCPRDEMNPQYYDWLFHSTMFSDEFYKWGHGIVDDLWTTNWQDMKRISIPEPPLDEQQRIAAFLDRKCAEIDAVIERTKATIEEYKKLKQAVITEAVTKGVRGPRPMKDSGYDFIGTVPNEWEVCRLRSIGVPQNGISKGGEFFGQGFPFVSYGDVYKNIALPASVAGLVESTEDERERYSVQYGDIFFTRTSETIEEVGFSSVCLQTIPDATFAGFLIRVRPYTDKLFAEYSKYYFRSSHHRAYLTKQMNLVTRASLGQDLLKSMPVLLPSIEEQKEIAAFLDEKCAALDTLIAKKTALLTELETYKKSLIYEYVTGKKECLEVVEQAAVIAEYPFFPAAVNTKRLRFAQAMMMAKILDMHGKGMGRVKLEKMLYTIETSIGFDFDTEYVREAAGPLHESIYKCEGIISRQNHWYQLHQSQYGVSYTPTKDAGKYRAYYDKYFSAYNAEIERIIDIFKPYSTDQAEIVATLFAAWNDAIIDRKSFTDEDIVDDVLNNWHDNKKRFPKDVWLRAMEQMRKNNLIPKGYGKHTVMKAAEM